jgi:hypothetical protein
MLALIGIAVILVVAYVLSLKLNPLWPCLWCKGAKRHYSTLFPRARRRCWFCKGTGEKPRLGVRLFMHGTYAEIKAGRHGKNF